MEGPKATKPEHSKRKSGSQDENSTTNTLAPGDQSVISDCQDLREQQKYFISASSAYSSPQLAPQPEYSNVADLRASQIATDSDRLNLFQSGLQQLQETLDTPMSRWNYEADPSQEIARHYAPLSRPDSSIEETVLEDRSDKTENNMQGSSPINKPNFDKQAAFSERPIGEHGGGAYAGGDHSPSCEYLYDKYFVKYFVCRGRLISEDLSSFASQVPPALWKDELGRLRVWAANIGAHQTGQSSLDHRLRDASHIKEQTLRVLRRLQQTTEDINDVLHHSPEDNDFSDLSEDEDDDEHQTEIQSIYHALRDTVNNLFQLSMVIRKPAQHDRLLGTKRSDAVFYEPFDRLHVVAKYPQADEDILNRLGPAISQRRAVMRYRERHRTKLAQGLNRVILDQADGQSAILSDTVATKFVQDLPAAKNDLELLTVASQTSYAQTILNGAKGTVLPPPPKDSADGAPFECPYCFVIITITNRRAWARHVSNDLMPYLCIFPSCPTPHRLYESRRAWFSHLQSQHSISETPRIHVDCTLCLSSVPSGKQLERHVGRHLEELSLFALPRSEEEDDNIAAYSSDEDSVFPDLRAHIVTHTQTERPEKCPVVTCEYHTKGFVRAYDRKRHVLIHYKGIMVCDLCLGSGKPKERSFYRADVFKRHLVSVHGVEQMLPNQRNHKQTSSIKIGMNHTSNSTGNCSICSEVFKDAQDFYEHIDNCVMLKVMQENSPEAANHTHLAGVDDDGEMIDRGRHSSTTVLGNYEDQPYPRKGKTCIPRHLTHIHALVDLGYAFKEEKNLIVIQSALSKAPIDEVLSLSRDFRRSSPVESVEDPVDQPDYNYSPTDHDSSSELSGDKYAAKKETRPQGSQGILELEPDLQSAKEDNLPGKINLEVHEPAIGTYDTPNFWRHSSKDHSSQIREDAFSYTPDYLVDVGSTKPMHWDRRWDADENEHDGSEHYGSESDESEPDVIALIHCGAIYPLLFRAHINDGVLTVRDLRLEAARKVGSPFPNLIRLMYKENLLKDDKQTCKAEGLRHYSQVLCVVSEIGTDTLSDSSDYESGGPPQAHSKIDVNQRNKQTIHSSPLRDETETA
ncbi:Zinc finger C2H2 [Penicillium vulpinum]|uniref:Zinc finger C2H2 n=1 Tax=Penicillium vulpinum TaxID=29845 RepID=UPI002547C226|nr:Zinc finger C2H2 [Penicillium vulpinum]KAJ5961323.1 Zinc finger C2H2 [Penicillium vulpinum]